MIKESVKDLFSTRLEFIFALTIIFRVSFVVSIFILLYIFIHLTRGFLSQVIRVKEKMTSLRMLLFLVENVGKEFEPTEDEISSKQEIIKAQSDLINKHLPTLMDYNSSNFDTISDPPKFQEKLIEKLSELRPN